MRYKIFCLIGSLSFISCRKLVLLTVFLVSCSNEKSDNQTDEIINFIISDKGTLEKITIFPSDNPLNMNISQASVDSRSDAIIDLLGTSSVKPDFGSGLWEDRPIGIPFIHRI
jgi:hypothetical protein